MSIRHTVIAVISYGIIAIIGAYFGVRLYWSLQPSKVIDVMNNPAPVRPKEINPEATIIVSPVICKHFEARAYVKRTLLSSTVKILLPDYGNILPKGCSSPQLPIIIPGQTPDGVYHIEYEVTYHINPIKDDVEHWRTQEFVVKHVPPLEGTVSRDITVTPIQTTSSTTTNSKSTVTTTNDGNGNTTSTTVNKTPPGLIQKLLNFIGL